ncbi:efflux RND transporter permease subunit [bacterium]|nr:efflux RND transporter permease subunit [bacterium]
MTENSENNINSTSQRGVNPFISRPKFAIVISLTIVLAGLIVMLGLPLEDYPSITPPQVNVTATYTGASSDVIRDTVAAPLEAQLNGVEDMVYMTSTSKNGSYSLDVYFEVGTDPDMAVINVNNKLQLVTPRLPAEVRTYGLTVKKRRGGPGLLMVAVTSPNNIFDSLYIANYAAIYIKDELARIKGASDVNVYGSSAYSMRVWLDPVKLANYNLAASDVIAAIQSQNTQAAVGNLGAEPLATPQDIKVTLRTKGRLTTQKEFEDIVVYSKPDGSNVKLKDVARIDLGAESYDYDSFIGGKKNAVIVINQLPEANSIDLANKCFSRLQKLSESFPKGMEYKVEHDETDFIRESINEVEHAIGLAILLVALVTYVFLGSARAAFIPLCAIPVSLIGVFIFLGLIGFSINLLMLFGLVLAVGLVVDDAIVVLENVQRHIQEGKKRKEAAIVSMWEVTSAVVATSLVLMAVFVPVCFMPGVNGKMFQQFAVCIACSVGLSTVVALSLTPALCAMMLKDEGVENELEFIKKFNIWFNKARDKYMEATAFFVNSPKYTLITLGVLIVFAVTMSFIIPTAFIPTEDKGAVIVQIQLPDGSSTLKTKEIATLVEDRLMKIDGVRQTINIVGFSGENTSLIIMQLKPWHDRKKKEQSSGAIVKKVREMFGNFPSAMVVAFEPTPIPGLGSFGGFEYQLLDKGDRSPQELFNEAMKLIRAANADKDLTSVFTTYTANLPQILVEIDEEQALSQKVSINEIYTTLAAIYGATYVNDFNKFGRVYRVMVQADALFRTSEKDLNRLFVRNSEGKMVPITSIVKFSPIVGPYSLTRFNMYNAVTINGQGAGNISSGQAMKKMEELSKKVLPEDMSFAWSGTSLQEQESTGQIGIILALALIFVYLFLVALYESWTLPIAVMMIAPVSMVGALFAQYVAGYSLDLYCQVGLIMLIGLSTKQAILIIEFAKDAYEENGGDEIAAAMQAAKLRFRAVMMTNFAFILGILPLVFASGAGAVSRHSVGMTVLGGMMLVALMGTMLVPGFFVCVQKMKRQSGAAIKNNTKFAEFTDKLKHEMHNLLLKIQNTGNKDEK